MCDAMYASLSGTVQSPMVIMHVWYFGAKGAFWRKCRQNICNTPFSHFWVFLCSRNSSFWWSGTPSWHLWIGRARHPGPGAVSFAVEVFNVGGWLTHCDFALDVGVDFLAVVEHRLIPAGVRGEWARLRRKGWLLSGLLLLRIRLMLVMLGLGLSVSGVLLFPCLPLQLRSLSVF